MFETVLSRLGDLRSSLFPEAPAAEHPDGESQMASWLPYRSYLADERLFVNRDSVGFVLSVGPQSGADERMVEVLAPLFKSCPAGTGIQFNLFGSPHVYPILREYASLRKEDDDALAQSTKYGRPARNQNLYRRLARQRVEHLLDGSKESLSEGYPYKVRHFRAMLSVALPLTGEQLTASQLEEVLNLRTSICATLRAAALANYVCDASDLINWVKVFLNPDRMLEPKIYPVAYDAGRELHEQIVDFDTIQEPTPHGLRFSKPGGRHQVEMRMLSVRHMPEHYALAQMGAWAGDLVQPGLQYPCPFLITMGVHIPDPNRIRTEVTANHIRATQNADSQMAKWMPDFAKKLQDWRTAADTIDTGGTLVYMYHQIALLATPDEALQSEEACRAILRNRGFELNSDTFMHRQSLLMSLPMSLSVPMFHDLSILRRVTRKFDVNAVNLLPAVTEWTGTATPVMITAGRRGQLMGLDLFDNDMGGYNAAVIGGTGAGKSVFLQELAQSYLATGARVWALDIGRSFQKLCKHTGGQFIEFTASTKVILNPFTVVTPEVEGPNGPEGGIKEDIDMLVPAIAKMASMDQALDEVQRKAISAVILQLWPKYGRGLTMTRLQEVFRSGTIEELGLRDDQRIRDLAVMLHPYCRGGQYERFFEGENTIDFSSNFIVLENEELKRRPDLLAVVTMLMMYQITTGMFGDRSRKKLLLMDELKQQLGEVNSQDTVKAALVEGTARRARKYGGSLVTASQQAEDYYETAAMEAAMACADWTFLLRQKPESIELLQARKRLAMDEGLKRVLTTLMLEPGVFSEMYIKSPVGEGVARLLLDPWTHLLYSNRPDDNIPMDRLQAQGLTVPEAIEALLQQRGSAA